MAYFLLEETHLDMQPEGSREDHNPIISQTPLFPDQGATADEPANLMTESYGTFNSIEVQHDETWHVRSNGDWVETPEYEKEDQKVFTKTVLMFVVALGIFTYHSVSSLPDLGEERLVFIVEHFFTVIQRENANDQLTSV